MRTLSGKTARQELVDMAGRCLRRGQIQGGAGTEEAVLAIESVTDGGQPGTLGGEMRGWWLSANDAQVERLIADVRRAAK